MTDEQLIHMVFARANEAAHAAMVKKDAAKKDGEWAEADDAEARARRWKAAWFMAIGCPRDAEVVAR